MVYKVYIIKNRVGGGMTAVYVGEGDRELEFCVFIYVIQFKNNIKVLCLCRHNII